MTRDEMLRRLGLTELELEDLLDKYRQFHKSLSDRQRVVMTRSLPSVEEAIRSFGPDVTVDDMQILLDPNSTGAMFSMYVAVVAPGHKP